MEYKIKTPSYVNKGTLHIKRNALETTKDPLRCKRQHENHIYKQICENN